jgi:adenylosuccinate synthase
VILNHSKRVSGISHIAVTVLDVLSGLKELKICISYNHNGKEINYIPADINEYSKVTPNYITMPGWEEDISNVTCFEELPINAQNYLRKIEELSGLEVVLFSVGPNREQTIEVKSVF